jgi:RNA polymerase sigma factor (sigma-70 family)
MAQEGRIMERKPDRMDATRIDSGAAACRSTDMVTGLIAGVDAGASASRDATRTRIDGVVADLSRELTRRERLVVMLRYTEELTVAEIAAVLEIAATEVERMLESIAERVRRRIKPTYGSVRRALA